MVKRYSETRFNSEGFDSPANEIGVFENSHGEYVKFTDYDSREGELLVALSNIRPLLTECDCIHSDREDQLCPCRVVRALLESQSDGEGKQP